MAARLLLAAVAARVAATPARSHAASPVAVLWPSNVRQPASPSKAVDRRDRVAAAAGLRLQMMARRLSEGSLAAAIRR